MAIKITQEEARTILRSGGFVTVTFRKKDGSIRVLNGRSGVKAYIKKVGLPYDAKEHGIVILWETRRPEDQPSQKYRAIRLESIIKISANGAEFFL